MLNLSTTYAEFLQRKSPGLSPTVNISWFITKHTSLIYTTQFNITTALLKKHATTSLISINSHHYNKGFAEHSLLLMLSTQWTAAYDMELQVMLGFYSLCTFLFYKTDRRRSVVWYLSYTVRSLLEDSLRC